MTGGHAHAAPPTAARDVAAWWLFATLGISGALAGLLIVVAWQWTLPTITRNKAARLQAAVEEVLGGPDRFDTLYVVGDALSDTPPGRGTADQVYVGYSGDGRVIGFAVNAAQPGFADLVRLIFGHDAASHRLLGIKVLENKENAGTRGQDREGHAVFGCSGGLEATTRRTASSPYVSRSQRTSGVSPKSSTRQMMYRECLSTSMTDLSAPRRV